MSDNSIEKEIRYSAEETIGIISDKWSIEVLRALRAGENRHGLLSRAIPEITKKMLTQTLRKLERNGIVERKDYQENPSRVEYYITAIGDTLIERLTMMCEWSKMYLEDIEKAREDYDSKA